MNTREQIIQLADSLIREKGYNAFSFYDISKSVGIKTASIHYHFPAKSDLGIAVIEHHIQHLELVKKKFESEIFCLLIRINKETKKSLSGIK